MRHTTRSPSWRRCVESGRVSDTRLGRALVPTLGLRLRVVHAVEMTRVRPPHTQRATQPSMRQPAQRGGPWAPGSRPADTASTRRRRPRRRPGSGVPAQSQSGAVDVVAAVLSAPAAAVGARCERPARCQEARQRPRPGGPHGGSAATPCVTGQEVAESNPLPAAAALAAGEQAQGVEQVDVAGLRLHFREDPSAAKVHASASPTALEVELELERGAAADVSAAAPAPVPGEKAATETARAAVRATTRTGARPAAGAALIDGGGDSARPACCGAACVVS